MGLDVHVYADFRKIEHNPNIITIFNERNFEGREEP
jgi:hypothetical protein